MWLHTRYGMIMSTATEQTTEVLMGVDTFLKGWVLWAVSKPHSLWSNLQVC